MAEIVGHERHVTDLLGLYYVDALAPSAMADVDRHLGSCGECRTAADEVIDAIVALELLSDDDRRDLTESFGAQRGRGPVRARPADPSGSTPPSPAEDPRARRTGPPNRRPARRRARRRALIGTGGLLVLVLALGSLTARALIRDDSAGGGSTRATTVAAAAADDRTGASVSISATQSPSGEVRISATVHGLTSGQAYRLVAVTTGGRSYPVADWTSDGKVQDVTGAYPAPLTTLSYVTVNVAGRGPVVAAYLAPAPSPDPSAT